jgi:hypothetical protein
MFHLLFSRGPIGCATSSVTIPPAGAEIAIERTPNTSEGRKGVDNGDDIPWEILIS